jgi:hypothetical protein
MLRLNRTEWRSALTFGMPDHHDCRTQQPECNPTLFPVVLTIVFTRAGRTCQDPVRPTLLSLVGGVTVDEGITSPASASEPCMRVSTSHGSSVIRPLSWAPCWACDLHVGAFPLTGHPNIAQRRAQGFCSATYPDHLHITVPTSAYPRAFLAALAF